MLLCGNVELRDDCVVVLLQFTNVDAGSAAGQLLDFSDILPASKVRLLIQGHSRLSPTALPRCAEDTTFAGEASEAGKHRMVSRSNTSANQVKSTASPAEEAKPTVEHSAPSEQSWLGSLGTWGQGQLLHVVL